eukprot:m.136264 g.136264  ORF g.136264 m.136264 type:complete len:507 (+) comp16579_c0_seq2:237-1757(+)
MQTSIFELFLLHFSQAHLRHRLPRDEGEAARTVVDGRGLLHVCQLAEEVEELDGRGNHVRAEVDVALRLGPRHFVGHTHLVIADAANDKDDDTRLVVVDRLLLGLGLALAFLALVLRPSAVGFACRLSRTVVVLVARDRHSVLARVVCGAQLAVHSLLKQVLEERRPAREVELQVARRAGRQLRRLDLGDHNRNAEMRHVLHNVALCRRDTARLEEAVEVGLLDALLRQDAEHQRPQLVLHTDARVRDDACNLLEKVAHLDAVAILVHDHVLLRVDALLNLLGKGLVQLGGQVEVHAVLCGQLLVLRDLLQHLLQVLDRVLVRCAGRLGGDGLLFLAELAEGLGDVLVDVGDVVVAEAAPEKVLLVEQADLADGTAGVLVVVFVLAVVDVEQIHCCGLVRQLVDERGDDVKAAVENDQLRALARGDMADDVGLGHVVEPCLQVARDAPSETALLLVADDRVVLERGADGSKHGACVIHVEVAVRAVGVVEAFRVVHSEDQLLDRVE